mgnify:CR=1 FL=1
MSLPAVSAVVPAAGPSGWPAFGGFGAETLAEGVRLTELAWTPVGDDLLLDARVASGFDPDSFIDEIARLDSDVGGDPGGIESDADTGGNAEFGLG